MSAYNDEYGYMNFGYEPFEVKPGLEPSYSAPESTIPDYFSDRLPAPNLSLEKYSLAPEKPNFNSSYSTMAKSVFEDPYNIQTRTSLFLEKPIDEYQYNSISEQPWTRNDLATYKLEDLTGGGGWVPGANSGNPEKPIKYEGANYSPAIRYGTYSAAPRSYGHNFVNTALEQYLRSYDPGKPLEYKSIPTFAAPAYDEARVRRLGRKQAAPYISEIQNAINRGIARLFGRDFTPGARDAARNLMSGVSEGINKAQATGAAYGRQVYGDIYNREYDAARANYLAQVEDAQQYNQRLYNTAMMTYQAALRNMMAG